MLKSVRSRVDTFLHDPIDPFPYQCFRVGLALFGLLKLIPLYGQYYDLTGNYGLVQWLISASGTPAGLPHLTYVYSQLRTVWPLEQEVFMGLFWWLQALAYVWLLTGRWQRPAAWAAWLLHLTWLDTASGFVYGVDIFTHIGLTYLLIVPTRRDRPVSVLPLRLLQIQLCLVYYSAGIEKALSPEWQTGEALWRALMLPDFNQFDWSWLIHVPWLAQVFSWLVIGVEVGYCVGIWLRPTRRVWIVSVVLLHLGIGMCLGLWLFAGVMVLLTLTAFGYPELHALQRQVIRQFQPPPCLPVRSAAASA